MWTNQSSKVQMRGGGGGGGGGMMKPRIDPRMSKTINMGGTWLLH